METYEFIFVFICVCMFMRVWPEVWDRIVLADVCVPYMRNERESTASVRKMKE